MMFVFEGRELPSERAGTATRRKDYSPEDMAFQN
jgi:hypothetical protein